jgi:regulator of sigma E protease
VAIAQMILSFLVAIVILVTIHEFGHFYVARKCGVKVLRFSIGFGRILYSWHDKQGTQYAIAAIPLGGYVKMLDEREGTVPENERHRSFNAKNVWQRMAIVIAGPLANFLLAILLFWGLMLPGTQDLVPVIGKVEPGSIAAHAGLEEGQEVLSVDGELTPTRQAFYQQLLRRLGESGTMRFALKYPESTMTYESEVVLDRWLQGDEDPDPVSGLGLTLFTPPLDPVASLVTPGSPADKAGLLAGDRIISVDDQRIETGEGWINYVRQHPDQLLRVEVEREGRSVSLAMTPETVSENGETFGRVGMAVQSQAWPEEMIREFRYSLGGAFVAGMDRTWETAGFVLVSVKKLILGEISTKNLSGPISIAKVAGSSAESGLKSFIAFLALLSIFLGVFNLLPIPILDGGHLLYFLIEAIKGSPVSEKIQMAGYQVGLFLVVGLSVLAFYNDIMRL